MNTTNFTGNIERYSLIRRNEDREEAAYEKAIYEDSRNEDYVEGRVEDRQ